MATLVTSPILMRNLHVHHTDVGIRQDMICGVQTAKALCSTVLIWRGKDLPPSRLFHSETHNIYFCSGFMWQGFGSVTKTRYNFFIKKLIHSVAITILLVEELPICFENKWYLTNYPIQVWKASCPGTRLSKQRGQPNTLSCSHLPPEGWQTWKGKKQAGLWVETKSTWVEASHPFFLRKSPSCRITGLAVPLGACAGRLLPCGHPLLPTTFPEPPLAVCTPEAGLHPPAFCPSLDRGSRYATPSPTFLLQGSPCQVCDGQEESGGRAGERGTSSWRAGGGRAPGVQMQPGRGSGDSACRAAWSCGRVWKCLYTLDSFSFPKFSVSGSTYF